MSDRVAEPFWTTPGRKPFRHGPTYAGHAACCAAGLANLDIMEREGLVTKGQELEGDLYDALAPLADHPLVSEVRGGLGLLAAVELAPEVVAATPGAAGKASVAIREAGVLVRALISAFAISPPLTISPDEIRVLADGVRSGLDAFAETL